MKVTPALTGGADRVSPTGADAPADGGQFAATVADVLAAMMGGLTVASPAQPAVATAAPKDPADVTGAPAAAAPATAGSWPQTAAALTLPQPAATPTDADPAATPVVPAPPAVVTATNPASDAGAQPPIVIVPTPAPASPTLPPTRTATGRPAAPAATAQGPVLAPVEGRTTPAAASQDAGPTDHLLAAAVAPQSHRDTPSAPELRAEPTIAAGPQPESPSSPAPTGPVERPAAPAAPTLPAPLVMQQVSHALIPELRRPDGSYRITVQLHPDELGPVTVTVELSAGTVHLHVRAHESATADLLRDGADDLHRQLADNGLDLGGYDVSAGDDGTERDPMQHQAPAPLDQDPTGAAVDDARTTPAVVPVPAPSRTTGRAGLDLQL